MRKTTSVSQPYVIALMPLALARWLFSSKSSSRRLALSVIGSVAVCLALVAGCLTLKDRAPSSVFRNAPEFELQNRLGQKVKLSDFRGRYIVLHFWATWCPPCLLEIVQWVERAQNEKSRSLPVQWVAISLDQSWQDVDKIYPSHFSFPSIVSLLDPDIKIAELYGTYQFPETYLISPELKILKKWVGTQDWNGTAMEQFIGGLPFKSDR